MSKWTGVSPVEASVLTALGYQRGVGGADTARIFMRDYHCPYCPAQPYIEKSRVRVRHELTCLRRALKTRTHR